MKTLNCLFIIASLFICSPLHAEASDWSMGTETEVDGYYYAATTNDTGNILGQYCYFESGSCLYIVGMAITCDENEEYPALINSDAGTAHITLICGHKFQGENVLFVTAFEDIDRIVRTATHLAIAIAIENDQFKVSRYTLNGAKYAIDQMRSAAETRIKRQPKNTNRPSEEIL